MQEVASHSLTYTSSPLESKKGVQHEEENFCFGKIRHTRRFIGGFATNNVYSSSQTSFGSNGSICTISL